MKDLTVLNNQDLTITKDNVNLNQDLAKYLTKEEIDQQIKKITNFKHKMLVKFLWMSGVRVTEAINVRKKDIDLDNYLLKVMWQKNRKWKNRILPIHPQLRDILEVYIASMLDNDKLFPFTRTRAYQITKKYVGCSPHQLRHSFAVHWLKSGGEITILSRVLGHSDLKTTMEYLKIVPVDQGRELLKIQF